MPKEKIFKPRVSTKDIKKKIQFYYMEKFFNKWMNKYDFVGLNYQQKHFIMKKLWSVGSVACSQIKSADPVLAGLMENGEIDMGENSLIFTPWAFDKRYNIYDFPTHLRLINTRGVKFITEDSLEIDKDAVIIYAQKNHKSVFSSIEAKINELVDIEMKKRLALKSQSQPWLFAFSPEDYEQAKVMVEQLESDNPYMFVPLQEVDKAKSLSSGASYILDKLQNQCDHIENQILTMMGVNNIGIGEKKEHLVVDEINANNEDIEQQSISYKSELEDSFDRVNSCFGKKIEVIDINEMFKEVQDEVDEKEDYEDESMFEK